MIVHTELTLAGIEQREEAALRHLAALLSQDLGFHRQDSGYASHNFHSFPAKFPPQLPRLFIETLTAPGDAVLDPMVGSGTTLLEAFLLGRYGIGFDIDPLALLLTRTKVTPLVSYRAAQIGREIVERARQAVRDERQGLEQELSRRWDAKTRDFVSYWFAPETQIALLALIREIERLPEEAFRAFFRLAFSAIIITKSGGVSLAFDLAHTRPHRARVVINPAGQVILGGDLLEQSSRRARFLTKKLRSPLEEFEKRVEQNIKGLPNGGEDGLQLPLEGLLDPRPAHIAPCAALGNAQSLPLPDHSIDLIVTSPPYASNAIDYMRAHKFSLVWLGYPIDDLGEKRRQCIGGESVTDVTFEVLPTRVAAIVEAVAGRDEKKGRVLYRYYSEMARTLQEMFRVLKPGRAAIVVVGNSTLRGVDTETAACLAEIGQMCGFKVPKIGVRSLDRDRRMMPAGAQPNLDSQIQQRMHEEYVIGFYKPLSRQAVEESI